MNPELDSSYIKRLPALISVFQSLANFNNLDDLLKFVIGSVTDLIEADRTTLFLVDHYTQELYSSIAQGIGKSEIRFPIGTGIAGTVAKEKSSILIPDAYLDARFNQSFDQKSGYRTRNILCMPMQNIEGKVIGVIQVLNKLQGDFLPSDQLLLRSFCTHAAVCIESTLLFCKMEELVAQRTEEVRSALRANRLILENIKDGFLICDRQGMIQEGYSLSCEALLGRQNLAGQSLFSLDLKPLNPVEANAVSQLPNWLEYGFLNPLMEQWEELSTLQLKSTDSVLQVAFQRLFEQNSVKCMMVLLSDITQKVELEKEVERKSRESQNSLISVTSMVQHGKASFERFMAQLRESLPEIAQAEAFFSGLHSTFRTVHTLKGMAQTFNLDHISSLLHSMEDKLAKARAAGSCLPEDRDLLAQDLRELYGLNSQLVTLFKTIFSASSADQVALPLAEWQNLLKLLPQDHRIRLLKFQAGSAYWMGDQLKSQISSLGLQLGKDVVFEADLTEVQLEKDTADSLMNCFLHIVRNSLDHGIESKEKRLSMGKPACGKILFTMKLVSDGIVFTCEDDGQGILLHRVRSKAEVLGLLQAGEVYTEEQILECLFQPGFSTQEEVTEISGRGVGLDFVRATVHSLKGTISLHNRPNLGTCFQIFLPLAFTIPVNPL